MALDYKKIFEKMALFSDAAKKRRQAEYAEFFDVYEAAVKMLPPEVTKKISIARTVVVDGSQKNWSLKLNVTDLIWWKKQINERGVYFVTGAVSAQCAILNEVSDLADIFDLSLEQKEEFLRMFDVG